LIVILASMGRYLIFTGSQDHSSQSRHANTEKVLKPEIPWHEVDKAVSAALKEARASAESYASSKLDTWIETLMVRVDEDFLTWYFSYWNQQVLGLKALWNEGLEFFFENQPSTAEKLTAEIQEEFAKRVLRPQIAELELERIVGDTAHHYASELQKHLKTVPATYNIPKAEWNRYLEGIAITAYNTDANRETPISLKAFTASSAGGAVFLAANMKALLGKFSSKIAMESGGKAASKMAAKTGGKVAAKAGGKLLGPIVGIGIIVWDIWDHNATKAENKPILRKAIQDYLKEVKNILLHDSETGVMASINDLERQVLAKIRQNEAS
jgi:hypothetical protein